MTAIQDASDAWERALLEIKPGPVSWVFEPREAPKAPSRRVRRALRRDLHGRGILRVDRVVAPTCAHSNTGIVDGLCLRRSLALGSVVAQAAEALTRADDWRVFPIQIHADACRTCETEQAMDCTCETWLTWGGARC